MICYLNKSLPFVIFGYFTLFDNISLYKNTKMDKKLAKAYTASKDYCGKLVTKQEVMHIQISEMNTTKESSTMTMIIPQQQQQIAYHSGKVYRNTYVPYCCCWPFHEYSTNSWEIQMNGEKIVESSIPFCCPCLGPFSVKNKNDMIIGQLQPHCYICHAFIWSLCCACCMSLDVKDQSMRQLYNIRRRNCTCWGCLKWDVFDPLGNIRGEFQQTGWCCPNWEILLPDASQKQKQLVLGSMLLLP